MHSCVRRVRVMFSDWRKLMRISRLDFDINWGVCNTLHDNGETQGLSILSSDLTGERHRSTVAPLLIFTNLCALNLRVSNLSATFQSKPRHPTSHITISHPSVENIHLNIHPWQCHGDAGMDGPSVLLVIASVMTFLPLIDCLGACISTLTPRCHNQSTVSVDDQWSVNYDVQMFSCFHLRVSRGWRRIQLRRDEEMCVK